MIRFISEFWSALCVVPLVVLVAYQILKPWIGWSFDHELGAPIGTSWVAFVLLGMLLFLLLISFARRNVFRCGALSTGMLVFLLGWSSVMLQKVGDGDVESLFSLGWQEAGSYAATVGLRKTISSWNSSANSQGDRGFDEPSPIWVKSTAHLGLRSNPGETWMRSDRRFNNRMNLHPPVYALALSLWMRIVGENAYVSLAFGLAIKCLLVILVAVWTRERLAGDQRGILAATVVVLFASLPPLLLQIELQNHELGVLFSGVALLWGMRSCRTESRSPWNGLLIGVLLCCASFTSFFQVVMYPALIFSMLVFGKRREWIQLSWVTIAYLAVAMVFIGLGYYPWLTIYTSTQLVELYRLNHPVDLLTALLEHAYLGIPIWLLLCTAMRPDILKNSILRVWMLPPVVAFGASLCFSFGTITGQRYSAVFLFAMVPLIIEALRLLQLSRHQMLTIPVSNVLFVAITVFL